MPPFGQNDGFCPFLPCSMPVDIKLSTGGHQAPNRWTSSSQPVDIKLSTGGHQAPNPWTSSSQPVDIKLPTGGHQAPKVYVTLNFRWGERPREPRERFDARRLARTLAPPTVQTNPLPLRRAATFCFCAAR